MKRQSSRNATFGLALLFGALAAHCSPVPSAPSGDDKIAPGGSSSSTGGQVAADDDPELGGGGTGTAGQPGQTLPCEPPEAHPLPARSVVSADAGAATQIVFTRDIFAKFQAHCGACHVDTSLGGFDGQKVSFANFADVMDETVLAVIQSEDIDDVMPPRVAGGKPWSERDANDPLRELVRLLTVWIEAGKPADLVVMSSGDGSDEKNYSLAADAAENLTNLGNCLPDEETFAQEANLGAELDETFANMTELPAKLSDTDLSTLDQALLNYRGVAAFAPAYPLWTDDAGKLRHVRVPRGQKIRYQPESNSFDIPENTRFYKTFFKEVVDVNGEKRWRKMETRVIVTRKDECSADGCESRGLFGTYLWNEDESEATLLADPLRSGAPFGDRLLTYITNEKAVLGSSDPALLAENSRHYAVPGAIRCQQCHLGSPSHDMILGFTPLQINRRAYVEEPDMFAPGEELVGHGILASEKPTKDEREQLMRLVKLGVIEGIEDSEDVPGLRDASAVPPRNGFELEAQGYMLAHCAPCHNPSGYTSRKHPELSDLLDFAPESTGIYRFPLERYSPRTQRGPLNDVRVPYISPSLYDQWATAEVLPSDSGALSYQAKCLPSTLTETGYACALAPWRGMIYRNVETPFTYGDDYAVFPHMPRHSPGIDCRASKIMGDWMVSIPAVLKAGGGSPPVGYLEATDPEDQPYTEVALGEEGYEEAVAAARERITAYHAGDRYNNCPEATDIVDPEVLAGDRVSPADRGYLLSDQPFTPWLDNVPDRPHFVSFDPTDPPGDWTPRRADWADYLLAKDGTKLSSLSADEQEVLRILREEAIELTSQFRSYALEEQPFGFWLDPNGSCTEALSTQATIGDLPPETLPRWIAEQPSVFNRTTDPLYMQSPGSMVFSSVCRNCHGPAADADSALAGTISEITGGATRVANLAHGLFGPKSDPGTAMELVFADGAADLGVGTEDLALRYLLWMALGGTKVAIPDIALIAVMHTPVLGEFRFSDPKIGTPNMLLAARNFCSASLPVPNTRAAGVGAIDPLRGLTYKANPLVFSSGDAEMWTELCSRGQGAPIRMIGALESAVGTTPSFSLQGLASVAAYGEHPVMTRGGLLSAPDGASVSWCIVEPSDSGTLNQLEAFLEANRIDGARVPYCPSGVAEMSEQDVEHYALRGAMNAGLAAFTYLQGVADGSVSPQLQYNECLRLPGVGSNLESR